MQTIIADVSYNGTTIAVLNGPSIGYIERVSQGVFRLDFVPQDQFLSAHYAVVVTPSYTAGGAGLIAAVTWQDATSVRVEFFRRDNGQYDDPMRFSLIAMG